MANLTFVEMQDEVIRNAFNESNRPQVKMWLNDYYRRVWGLIDWPFRIPDPASLSITAGDSTPTMPSDLMRVIEIIDDDSNPLAAISQEDYDDAGLSDTDTTGKPSSYWMRGRQAVLGPIPDRAYTYTIKYERGLTHRDTNGAYVAGNMTATSDQLYWDGFEWLVIFGARAMGKVQTNNPTWPGDQDQADAMLLDMMAEWFPVSGQPVNYGRDRLGTR